MSLNGENTEDICRDFLRNACTRGKNCKFKHPAPQDLKKYAQDVGLPFCHDYQNRGCERPNCRYMHISRDEETQIKETGIIPQHLISETSKNILHETDLGVLQGETPLCKDYQKGTCNRGMMCKFRHVDLTQDYSAAAVAAAATGYAQYGATEQQYYEGAVAPPQKRQMYDADYYNRIGGTATASYYRPATATDYYSSYYRLGATPSLTDENKTLREEVEKMKLQLAELRAANDLLLEQNARLRVTKEQTGSGSSVLTSVAPAAEHSLTSQDSSTENPPAAASEATSGEPGGSWYAGGDSTAVQPTLTTEGEVGGNYDASSESVTDATTTISEPSGEYTASGEATGPTDSAVVGAAGNSYAGSEGASESTPAGLAYVAEDTEELKSSD